MHRCIVLGFFPPLTICSAGHRCEVHGQNLRGPGEVRRVGLLRRVQPPGGGGAVGRVHADPGHSGLAQTSQEDVRLARQGGQTVQNPMQANGEFASFGAKKQLLPISLFVFCLFFFAVLSKFIQTS